MISDARGGHVSPGIYTEEKDVTYSVKSLGITSLGLVGETLYGPAFENIEIENWGQFVDYFGGTSPEKFKGTNLPKYELPYVAKSYLEESKRLNVVRVLGLSGYKAGPVWAIKSGSKPLVILRSKMKYASVENDCETNETCSPIVTSVTIADYAPVAYDSQCVATGTTATSVGTSIRFQIKVVSSEGNFNYNVSMNPSDNDYIYKVISSDPEKGNTPIYIDAIFENSLSTKPSNGAITPINDAQVAVYDMYDVTVTDNKNSENEVTSHTYTYTKTESAYTPTENYSYEATVPATTTGQSNPKPAKIYTSGTTKVVDAYGDFEEPYRCAITPWIVSEVAASSDKMELHRLFRFYTISDGNAANYQVKVSIQNIRPDEGTFDVVVRDFNDTDSNPMVLEKFSRCSLVEGDASYIAIKIGTVDGGYESKSKYIAVEMYDGGEDLSNHIPAGFLGYTMPDYGSQGNNKVSVNYYTKLNPEIKPRRQYFGFAFDGGVVERDILSYKGRAFYNNVHFMTNGFHLDSVIDNSKTEVDGATGYTFTTVSKEKVGSETKQPRFINAPITLEETIYKDVNNRKFTVLFAGGFDGWDVNRTANGKGRSNLDMFKASRYKAGDGSVFKKISDGYLNLPSTAITSDYYAYLAGYRVFANPQDVDINVFATPGINWEDHRLLTEEALDVIEDTDDGRGGDALYIMNAPDGYDSKAISEMFYDSDIDSSYAATYFPWVMYYDASNKRYLNLPVTKDVVRNMAKTDNTSFPWFAPAGIERGEVRCVKAVQKTTLADEDDLYENRVNPVKTFAQDGVRIWGNKTAYRRESPLNRVNVRRLMIRVKKLISEAAKHLIFEQYDDTLEKQFKGLVEPILANVRANRGIYDYRVITEVTPETRDQHILPAKVLIKPTPALEYISISFVVYPESVSFEEN